MNRIPSAGMAAAISHLLSSATAQATAPQLHDPRRGDDETFGQYKVRRSASKRVASNETTHGLNGGTNSRKTFRDSMRANGTMGKRVRASDALMAAWAAKRITKAKLRDEHGALTFTGRSYNPDGSQNRRVWLAGISEQRGY